MNWEAATILTVMPILTVLTVIQCRVSDRTGSAVLVVFAAIVAAIVITIHATGVKLG